MKYKLVIFDLDGTILDTLEDLAGAMNHTLKENGFPERTLPEIRSFVGNGIRKLIERSAPAGTPEEIIQKLHTDFTAYYQKHCTDNTHPYPGIPELLKELRAKGIRTAVSSNKPGYGVQALCALHFPGLFDVAVGEQEGIRRKPEPDSANYAMKTTGIAKEDTVYIGDSDTDMLTAVNAGLPCISVCYGFRDEDFLKARGARVLAHDTKELRSLLLED